MAWRLVKHGVTLPLPYTFQFWKTFFHETILALELFYYDHSCTYEYFKFLSFWSGETNIIYSH
jgi:hypothetical protein